VVYGPDVASARPVVVAFIGVFAIASQAYEYIDWVLEVLDGPVADDVNWIGCAMWGMHATHFVGRSESRAQILARVDPETVPPGALRVIWLNDKASIAIAEGTTPAPFLHPMLDAGTTIGDAFWRLVCWGQTSSLAVLAGDLAFAGAILQRVAADPGRGTVPAADAFLAYFEGVYLAAIGDARALDCFERARRVSVECGWSLLEQITGSNQVSLLIDAGNLSAARERMIEAISGHIRAGDHLTLWQSCHQLVRLLAELGRQDQARELWAELHDRDGWSSPAQRADLEARLGPPGAPQLTDEQLIAHISALGVELE
jgi:hypothetical protein